MKKTAIFLLGIIILASCKNKPEHETSAKTDQEELKLAPVSDSLMETAVIYEANIRQYSKNGFKGFTKDIPELKELGVKIIWLMPIYPISMTKRKATPELSIEDITDPKKREKVLGSYYAISDYTALNPNLGTAEEFRKLVETAHANGMYVILDWVANHTGWDHHWLTEHPEYYTKNSAGEITDPINPGTGESWGWTDVADLNYESKELWAAMAEEMNYWVEEYDIDGFRADVASEVPLAFWEYAIPKLEKEKPLFMLAESQDAHLLNNAFDMGYNWGAHHILNNIAQGKAGVSEWDEYLMKTDTLYDEDVILMNFITNHDENAWNGTIEERLGDAAETMLALTYTMPGMPLIYSGQEYGLDHRLKFFVKDSIPKTKGKTWDVLAKLGELKNENPALNGGKDAAAYQRLQSSADDKILVFERSKQGEKIIFVANMTDAEVHFTIDAQGTFSDYMSGEKVQLKAGEELDFQAWEYKILIKE